MARWTPDDYADRGMRDYPFGSRIILAIVVGILWVFSKLMWRWRINDAEKLQPDAGSKTGSVIICNHTSMAEVVVIYVHAYTHGRHVRAIAKSEFYKAGIVIWLFSRAGAIPVDRGTADMKALRRAQHALQRGEDILIFPEGTRIRTDDQPVEIHGGFALMAQMGKSPIVPMAVCGFRDITPKGKHLMRPRTCWLCAGDKLCLEDAPQNLKRKERLTWLENEGMRRVYALRDDLRAKHPGRK